MNPSVKKRLLPVLLACLWLVAFYLFFYSQELPNAQKMENGNQPTRWVVWHAVDYFLLENIAPVREENAPASGWKYLPERAGFLLIALFVYSIAYCLGTGLFHLVRGKIKQVGRLEWHALSLAVGLSGLSLITLGLGLIGLLSRTVFLAVYVGIILFWAVMHARSAGGFQPWIGRVKSWFLLTYHKTSNAQLPISSPRIWGSMILAPFLMAIFLGAMLPSTDFDVKEYHFGGPKEYYQAGEIHFLPHNVYTSFPFLTEMLTLTGMVFYGDWYWGAVAGKTILAGFAPLTAWIIFLFIKRGWGEHAGWLGAIIYLTIPWTYRISIIAYTEGGLSLFLAATLLSAVITFDLLKRKKKKVGACLLCTGFLAGSAASCKYPGLISVTIPISLFFLGFYLRSVFKKDRTWKELGFAATLFISGILFSFGPWLAKNLYETGNPVYPLLYSVFGGTDWDRQLDAKWKAAHSPDHHQLSNLWTSFVDVTTINDWQSPLILGFGAIAVCLFFRKSSRVFWVFIYLIWLFLTWWVLTHRIDRFWVPMLPVASILAGVGAGWLLGKMKGYFAIPLLIPIIYNLAFITTELCGYNAYLIHLDDAKRITASVTSPEVVYLNRYTISHPGRVLSVGEAELFDAEFEYDYNTVFDYSLFAYWIGQPDLDLPEGEWKNRPAKEIREKLLSRNITTILVNWQEILRYRTSYKYTDFVTPERFQYLQDQKIIGPPIERTPFYQDADTLSEQQREEIESWAPELLVKIDGKLYFITTQIFPVSR